MASQHIFSVIVKNGYLERLYEAYTHSLPIAELQDRYKKELFNRWGLLKDIVDPVVEAIFETMQKTVIVEEIEDSGTLKDFFNDHLILSKPDIRISNNCYEGTTVPIQYIRLPKEIKGFNFMVMSFNSLKEIERNPSIFPELEVKFDIEYGWHVQMPGPPKSDLDFEW